MKVGDEVYLKFDEGVRGRVISHNVVLSNGDYDAYQDADLILASECGAPAMNQGHPNASILMEIAKEAAVNAEYWKEFEIKAHDGCWYPLDGAEISLGNFIDNPIRRSPRTIRIGNYDVPEPSEISIKHFDNSSSVLIDFDNVENARSMLKALQELMGAKK